ncbi:MAG TPA: phosphate uptake regulator PhoU [Candidatus Bathyarchaeia archaeon]
MSDLRKVQRTPTGTFFVCLPRAWADQHGLQRGSVVALNATIDGKLLVDPEYNIEQAPRVIALKPGPYLVREIIGKYLLGFDIIRVEAKERISLEVRDSVKKAVSRLVGLEIVEEDYGRIVLQCLLEPSGFLPEKILRRSYAIVAGMHRDVVNSFLDGDLQLAKSIVARDDESNRLYFLLVRILRTIVQNPSLSEKLGVSPIDCLDYRLAASLVEAIGDECVRIALKTTELESVKLTNDLKKLFANLHMACFEAHENALKAFLEGDIALADVVRNAREKIEKTFSGIEKVARAQSFEVVAQILAVASFLRQIYEHGVDISDLVVPKRV